MPYGVVVLVPGVNAERTPTLLRASISVSQYIRFRDALVQKLGGWQKYYPNAVANVPRDLHAWLDLDQNEWLAIGSTTALSVLENASSLTNITPTTFDSDFAPDFTTVSGSTTVTITDPNITNVTTYDAIFFQTPISVGGIILFGVYPISLITGVSSYEIEASSAATASVTSGGAVPVFTTTSGNSEVNVELADHGLALDDTIVFPLSTTGNGVTILGTYRATTITDADNFEITVDAEATSSGSFSMNGGNCDLLYYITIGPAAAGVGYGLGNYGEGGYGTGTPSSSSQTGTPITATDWTSDNWGEILLSCPQGGGVFEFDTKAALQQAKLISTAPYYNGGIFVSIAQQILVCWASTVTEDIGIRQDPLQVKWSTVGDFTIFQALVTNQAGSFHIPTGSEIRGGMAVSNQNLIWTDLDLWAMNYQGPPFVFGFNKIGSGAGAISSHAMQQLRGNVYWMGENNFYSLTGAGVKVIPCPVWDVVFQNLNTTYKANVRAMPNTPFNEVGWLYPSSASSSGECDSYVKFNITEPGEPWDYGAMSRSAWTDQTALGPPIAATFAGTIYQHETSPDDDGNPLMASFTTGYFYIAEGEDFAFVDQILPDFKWGEFDEDQDAQIQMSFNVVNFPGDTPITYGPYTVTQATDFISVRFRGRQMSISVSSSDLGSFWRLGLVRYRWAPAGRR